MANIAPAIEFTERRMRQAGYRHTLWDWHQVARIFKTKGDAKLADELLDTLRERAWLQPVSWPFPTWAVRSRPFDAERDA